MPGISGMDLLSLGQGARAGRRSRADRRDHRDRQVRGERRRRGAAPRRVRLLPQAVLFDAMTFTVRRLLERRRLKRQAHAVHALSVRLEAEKDHAQQAIAALVEAVYAKDNYTRGHMERVGRIAARLGLHMGASRGRGRDPLPGGHAARHRQDRHAGPGPQQAGRAHGDPSGTASACTRSSARTSWPRSER